MTALPRLPDFSSIVAGYGKQTVTWDFSLAIPPGLTLQGTPTVNLTVIAGNDPDPDSNIAAGPVVGTAQLTPTKTGTPNCAVLVQFGIFTPGLPGTEVVYRCLVTCPVAPNNAGFVDIIAGFNNLTVVTPP